ncbi:hypothetical protein R3P38DRAFT_3200682 [Favolaschia claudopus]|uniref:DUF6534 domain-containing protein n=1 Tax=Favolaschia claudopus TaxID=2862362 RepID=A0AAW0AXS4_9AGAR
MSTPEFDADSTLGALLIGTLVSFSLFGLTSSQTYAYWSRFPNDSWRLKSVVGVVWCAEFSHTICIGMALYFMLITNYGHPERLLILPDSLLAAAFLGSLVALVVQVFFSLRIYALSKSLYIPIICWGLSAFRFLPPNIILFMYRHRPATDFLGKFNRLFDAIWAASAANDILISGTCVALLYSRRHQGQGSTVAMVDKLIAWTIETGVVTSIASIILLIFFVKLPTTFAWLALFVVIPRLFSNSILASLNSRATLRSGLQQPRSTHSSGNPAITATIPRPMNATNLSIEMNKMVITHYDD